MKNVKKIKYTSFVKIVVCPVCKVESVDKSPAQTKIFCSIKCCQVYHNKILCNKYRIYHRNWMREKRKKVNWRFEFWWFKNHPIFDLDLLKEVSVQVENNLS